MEIGKLTRKNEKEERVKRRREPEGEAEPGHGIPDLYTVYATPDCGDRGFDPVVSASSWAMSSNNSAALASDLDSEASSTSGELGGSAS